jgi:hypothetical protein
MDEKLSAEDAIADEWFEIYERQKDVLYKQLISLNTNLFILEKIESFPFHLFAPIYDDRVFWRITTNALVEASIMIIWRIVADKDSNKLTLRAFKNQVFQNLKDRIKPTLGVALKQVNFEYRMAALERKVISVRHGYIAHLDSQSNLSPDPNELAAISLTLQDLKTILEIARNLFDVLCFNSYHSLWLWGYPESFREKQQTDIDQLLDYVARSSDLLNLPEKDPSFWKAQLQELSSNDLNTLNQYRRKFGLPDAS